MSTYTVTARALEAAAQRIENGDDQFMCLALAAALDGDDDRRTPQWLDALAASERFLRPFLKADGLSREGTLFPVGHRSFWMAEEDKRAYRVGYLRALASFHPD